MSDSKEDAPPVEAGTQPLDYIMSEESENPAVVPELNPTDLELNKPPEGISPSRHAFSDASNPSRLAAEHRSSGLEGQPLIADRPIPDIGETAFRPEDLTSTAILGSGKVSFDGVHSLSLYMKGRKEYLGSEIRLP